MNYVTRIDSQDSASVCIHSAFDFSALFQNIGFLHSREQPQDDDDLLKAAKLDLKQAQISDPKQSAAHKTQIVKEIFEIPSQSYLSRLADVVKHASDGKIPSVEIQYKNLYIEADALVGTESNPTVWNSLKSSLFRFTCQGGLKTLPVEILNDVSGIIKPGKVTLVLGPPGGGKSVFMQSLSGRLHAHKGLRITGDIKYNGEDISTFVVQRTAGLVNQQDRHIPNLTVIETIQFAADCQLGENERAETLVAVEAVAAESEALARELSEYRDASLAASAEEGHLSEMSTTDDQKNIARTNDEILQVLREGVLYGVRPYLILHLLGLSHTTNTFVGGDSAVRGVSGGERKRVTTAEVLVGPQWAIFMDEISTGLDSATTFSIVRSLRDISHALHRTIVISLLQPAPEVMNLFDDLLLMVDGKVIFHGPVEEAVPFFASLGFDCPPRKDPASFLQEVTTPLGQRAYASEALLDKAGVPAELRDPGVLLLQPPKHLLVSIDDIIKAYRQTPCGKAMHEELENSPFDPAKGNHGALARSKYARNGWTLSVIAFKRQFLLALRDKTYYIARVVQAVVMGLIIASFFRTVAPGNNPSKYFNQGRKVMSLCVLSTVYLSMSSMAQLTFVLSAKPVFYKHRDNHMISSTAYVLCHLLTQIFPSTIESVVFSLVVYFLSGLTPTAANFFIFLFVTWSASNCFAGFFRLVGYFSPNMVMGNAFGSLLLLLMMLTNGFSIIRTSIPPYLIWIYYGLNPFAYAVRALCINELTTPAWGIAGYKILESFGFFTSSVWIWINIGYTWGFLLLLTVLSAITLSYTNPPSPRPTVSAEDKKKSATRQLQNYIKRCSLPFKKPLLKGNNPTTTAANADDDAPMSLSTAIVSFTPISLVCRQICYYVNDPSGGTLANVVKESDNKELVGKLQLLKNIDFYAEPGRLTALMGGSGAGKTTLMDVVCGRKTQGIIRGDIIVNGRPKEQGSWSRVVGYVEQMDIHSPCITVRESLRFSARLRLDEATVDGTRVDQIVEQTLRIVELDGIANKVVGDPGVDGLSIEQRKRLSIAVEMVANPSVLFMDEPTSGLDARAAAIVMRAVRNVADSNRTVIVTIHQPSMEIFEAFDQLVLLQRGGRLTYFGPLGLESSQLIKYLESFHDVVPIKPGYNPATWMLEVTGGSMATTFKASSLDFPQAYLDSELRSRNLTRMEELSMAQDSSPAVSTTRKYATSYSMQAMECIKKYVAYYWRAPHYNFVRIAMAIGISLIYGLTFLNQGRPLAPGSTTPVGVATVQNIMGLIFSLSVFSGMFNCMTVMPLTASERVVFYRENASSMYAPRMMLFGQSIAEIPYLLTQAIVMVCIVYWMVGFQEITWKFFYFLLLFFLTMVMYTLLGQALVIATPNVLVAQLFAAFLNQIFTIVNGFLVPYPDTPVGYQWLCRLSPTTWILYGLGGSQLADSQVPFQAQAGTPAVATVGDFVQSFFGYDPNFIWWCPLIVAAYCVFFKVLAGVMLGYVNYNKR